MKRAAITLAVSVCLLGCAPTDDYHLEDTPAVTSVAPEPRCGDGIVQVGEDCDGTNLAGERCDTRRFVSGSLKCSECRFDTSGCLQVAPPGCGNRVADEGEECDGTDYRGMTCQSFRASSGNLTCTPGCLFDRSGCIADPVCGDGVAQELEECDGADLRQRDCASQGFASGTASCSTECKLDTSACVASATTRCGDSIAEGDEACDGADLRGNSCPGHGFSGGVMACGSDCQPDTSSCTSGKKCDFDGGSRTGVVLRANTEELAKSRVTRWSCSDGGMGPDVSVAWTAPESGCYQVNVSSDEDLDTLLGVFASCELGVSLACDDNSGGDQFSRLEFEASAGTTYAVVVDSYFNSDSGPVQVRVSPCAPLTWKCDPTTYGRGDGCDCGCGVPDPDCDGDTTAAACDFCDAAGSCAAGRTCDAIRDDANFACD